MVLEEDLSRYVWVAKHIAFPIQWKMLTGMRGLKESYASDQGRNDWKRRQVFFHFLTIICMLNRYLLSWWGMIHSVANFGWGVGATTSSAGLYWDRSDSATTKNKHITSLTSNHVWKYRRLLMKSRANLFLFDNFQIGHEVKEQQGEHDSAFFKDTDK